MAEAAIRRHAVLENITGVASSYIWKHLVEQPSSIFSSFGGTGFCWGHDAEITLWKIYFRLSLLHPNVFRRHAVHEGITGVASNYIMKHLVEQSSSIFSSFGGSGGP